MVTLIKKWPRLFTYASILSMVFGLALIWVLWLQPLTGNNSDQSSAEKELYIFYVFLMILIGLCIPLLISFSTVARQQISNIFFHSSNDNLCIDDSALLEAIEIVPAGIVMYDANDRLTLCNEKFRDIWGYSLSDTTAGVTHQQLGIIDRQRGAKVAGGIAEEYLESRLKYRTVFSEEQVIELPNGRLISTKDKPLTRGGFISVQTDITDLVEARDRLHKSERQLLDAIEGLEEGFVSFDKNDQLVIANSIYRKMYPTQKDITPGQSFEELIKLSVYAGEIPAAIGCEKEWIDIRLKQHHSLSPVDEYLLSNGHWVKISERRTENGGIVSISTDISEAKKNQATLELYATTDEMTGLLNRRTGLLMLNNLMAQFQRSEDELTICYIDIDELKSVNDEFGHDNGDLLIKIISNAAKEATREGDIIMRLGGDEFLIACPYCTTPLATKKMEAIKQCLKKTRESKKTLFELSFSYGTAAYSAESFSDVEEFVAYADKQMYKNKLNKKTA